MKPVAIALVGLTIFPSVSAAQARDSVETTPAAVAATASTNPTAAPDSFAPSSLPVGTTPPNPAYAPSQERRRERDANRPRFRYLPLLTAASGVFTLFYAPAAIAATMCLRGDSLCGANAGWLYLPLLGPFIAASDGTISTTNTLWIADGFAQLIGFSAMMIGLRPSERRWVTPERRASETRLHHALEVARWSAVPSVSAQFTGVTLMVENF